MGVSPSLVVRGATEHNLKNIDVAFPLGKLVVVTGVSGSGKSTLVNDVLEQALNRQLQKTRETPGAHRALEGFERIDRLVSVDQHPIGRSPKSNPATYTGVFDLIRNLFADMPEAKARGYTKSRFSFNDRKGWCPRCEGEGVSRVSMHFLADVEIACDACGGKRYNSETLAVKYRGKSIADVLEMRVVDAREFFGQLAAIRRPLDVLCDVGLGYMQLGQSSNSLSGGEAQRVKLAAELCRTASDRTLYVLDEPTVGLHFADVTRLLHVLKRLVEQGQSVIVVEHNLDVIAAADHVIDLGPDGGDRGGFLVAAGGPTEVANVAESYTGQYLAAYFGR
jgi:excinuclease ABC subunit A